MQTENEGFKKQKI